MQGVERFGHGGDLHLADGVNVLIEDEADLIFLHALDLIAVSDVALHKAGTGVQLERGLRVELALNVDRALDNACLVNVVLVEHAEIGRLQKVVPAATHKAELLAREGIHIAKAHAVEAGGTVDLDELAERLVELGGKILPVRVAHRGKGDEILRKAQLVAAVFREEGVVVDVFGGRAVHARRLLDLALVAREGGADGLLKVRGLARVDRQNGGEAQLADDLDELALAVAIVTVIGRDHNAIPPEIFKLIINYRGKRFDCQIARGEQNLPVQRTHIRADASQTTLAIPRAHNKRQKVINQEGETIMSAKNNNKINVPEAKAAMNKFKMEAAADLRVPPPS